MIEDVFAVMSRINEIKKQFGVAKRESASESRTSFDSEKIDFKKLLDDKISSDSSAVPMTRADIDSMVERISEKEGISSALVKAVISNESNYNNRAVSPKGAQGLMQLMPDTANSLGVKNIFSPEENITGGVRYLKDLLKKYQWDYSKALAAYNAGPRNVDQYNGIPPFAETRNYVDSVMKTYSGISKKPSADNSLSAGALKGQEADAWKNSSYSDDNIEE